jgi:hypothetical protein
MRGVLVELEGLDNIRSWSESAGSSPLQPRQSVRGPVKGLERMRKLYVLSAAIESGSI